MGCIHLDAVNVAHLFIYDVDLGQEITLIQINRILIFTVL